MNLNLTQVGEWLFYGSLASAFVLAVFSGMSQNRKLRALVYVPTGLCYVGIILMVVG